MKVVHICLVAYLDGWGYQENLLPEYMAKAGHEVVIVSSANHFPSFLKESEKQQILSKGTDYYYDGVHIYRIPTYMVTSNFAFICCNLYDILEKEKPDIIFHHGINSSSMLICSRYIKKHRHVLFFIDSHSDNYNQSSLHLWNLVVVRGIMRLCTKYVSDSVMKFYGVTPARCRYLRDAFGVKSNKISLLPIGCDTIRAAAISNDIKALRVKYHIDTDAFIVTSGGKMGLDKGTADLIEAITNLKTKTHINIRLLLFGRFIDETTRMMAEKNGDVYIFDWCDRITALELLKLSNVACWPVFHTTLIEDAIGVKVPVIIVDNDNTSHLIEGNGEYIHDCSCSKIEMLITKIYNHYDEYVSFAKIRAETLGYMNIIRQFEADCRVL